jgi:hypothetical protein
MPATIPSSYSSSSRPATPGGSSITDAIQAEIFRSSPRNGTSFDASPAAATSPAYPPASFNRTGSGQMASGEAGYNVRPAGAAGDVGGAYEEDEFKDARSVSAAGNAR